MNKKLVAVSAEEFLLKPRRAILAGSLYLFLKDMVEGDLCLSYMSQGKEAGLWKKENIMEEWKTVKEDLEFITRTKDMEKMDPDILVIFAVVEASKILDRMIEKHKLDDGDITENIKRLMEKRHKMTDGHNPRIVSRLPSHDSPKTCTLRWIFDAPYQFVYIVIEPAAKAAASDAEHRQRGSR